MKMQAACISRPDTFHPNGTDRILFNGQVSHLSNQDETIVHLINSKKSISQTFALFGNMTEGSLDGDVTGVCADVLRDAVTDTPVTDTVLDDAYAEMERAWKETGAHATVSAGTVSLFENGTMTISAVGDCAVVCIRRGHAELLYGKDSVVRGIGVPIQNNGTERHEKLEQIGQDGTTAPQSEKKLPSLHPFLLSQEILPGDVYLLASKSVVEAFSPEVLASCVADKTTAAEMADEIMDALSFKNVPGDQSVVVCMIAREKGSLTAKQKMGLLIGTAAVALIAVVIAVLVLFSGKGSGSTAIVIENYDDWKKMTVGDKIPLELEGDEADFSVYVEFEDVVRYDPESATLTALKAGTTKIGISSQDGTRVTKDILVRKKSSTVATTTTRGKTDYTHIPEDAGIITGTKKPEETTPVKETTAHTTAQTTEAPVTTTAPEVTETVPAETKAPAETTPSEPAETATVPENPSTETPPMTPEIE